MPGEATYSSLLSSGAAAGSACPRRGAAAARTPARANERRVIMCPYTPSPCVPPRLRRGNEVARDLREQDVGIDGLADEVGESGAVDLVRLRHPHGAGHRDDGHGGSSWIGQGPDRARGGQAVAARHVEVHQYDVVFPRLHAFYGFLPV